VATLIYYIINVHEPEQSMNMLLVKVFIVYPYTFIKIRIRSKKANYLLTTTEYVNSMSLCAQCWCLVYGYKYEKGYLWTKSIGAIV